MKSNKTYPFFKTSLFALALAAGSFTLAQTASAQIDEPGLSFYPTQSWKVAEVASSAGMPQCTISSTFNNGFVIAMNGTDKWVQSMAIDFRQNVFTPQKTYNVQVAVPGQFNQSFSAKAISPTAIQVDLRKSGNFYKSALQASVFDFTLEENSFRFYLTRFAAEKDKFEQCMASNTAPALADTTIASSMPKRTTPASADDVRMNEAKSFEEDIAVSNLDEARDAKARAMMQESSAAENLSGSGKPMSLMDEAETAEISRPAESKMPPLSADMSKPETVAADTQSKVIAPMPAESDDGFETTVVTPEPFEPKVKKVTTPDPIVSKRVVRAEADFAAMEDEKKHREKIGDLAQKISSLEKTINNLEEENNLLESELKDVLADSEQERLSISSENWNLERATMRYNEAERQVQRLGQQLQRERAQCNIEKQELEAMLFDPQVTDQAQMAKLADLERQLLAAQEKAENERMRYEERIRLLESQLQTN